MPKPCRFFWLRSLSVTTRTTFLDAGWGRLPPARDLILPPNMRLVFLPAYSPELNPMEHVWEEIREKWFPDLLFDGLQAVEDRLVEVVLFLECHRQSVASITGFDWIINIPLTAT